MLFSFSALACASGSLSLVVESVDGDFVETGFALARFRAVFEAHGKPVAGQAVNWRVISVKNRSEAMPEGRENRVEGLRWEHPYPGTLKIGEWPSVTDDQGAARAALADIIGERTVLLRAYAVYEGKEYSAEAAVDFGKGPLSVFAAPLPQPVTWLELYAICNGEPYSGDPEAWEVGIGMVGGGKMPSMQQVQAVSMPAEYNQLPSAMGAAVVAGWPRDKRYWNGRAVMKGRASHVNLMDGNPHGSGGNSVHAKEYGVCLR